MSTAVPSGMVPKTAFVTVACAVIAVVMLSRITLAHLIVCTLPEFFLNLSPLSRAQFHVQDAPVIQPSPLYVNIARSQNSDNMVPQRKLPKDDT
jgi:hypothetical protein